MATLMSNDTTYKELDQKAKNLPELRRALNQIRVNYD